jgi:arginyl-tRNA synthetase
MVAARTRPREEFRTAIKSRLAELDWPSEEIVVERPGDPEHGDWSSPIALALARPLKRSPREIAAELVAGLDLDAGRFGDVAIAGPAFINVRLAPRYLQEVVREILIQRESYGRSDRLKDQKINVEFVSSNPTGPLHIGHARNAALGDAIASLLESQGASVTREYYFNDAGRQMDMLGASVHARYQQLWNPSFPFPEGGYQGEYIIDLAKALRDEAGDRWLGKPIEECGSEFREFAGERMNTAIRADLTRFRVEFEVWFNESALYTDDRLTATIADLKNAGAVYEDDDATWFRASEFGDAKDRVLVKRTGQPTYLLPDIAYHRDKHERGFDTAIDIWGADHHDYAIRMRAALGALGYPPDWLRPVIYQQISLLEDGQEVRLSTRSDRMVLLADLMDDIGVDVTRYFLVMRKGDTHMVLDLDLARRQTEENPVYYVQYAHARICSVFGRLEEPAWDPETAGVPDSVDLLNAPTEIELLRMLDDYPDVVADAADALEPHRVTDYLESLARRFHLWYHGEHILVEDEPLARARLALARATQYVLRAGLGQLGVTAPESM